MTTRSHKPKPKHPWGYAKQAKRNMLTQRGRKKMNWRLSDKESTSNKKES